MSIAGKKQLSCTSARYLLFTILLSILVSLPVSAFSFQTLPAFAARHTFITAIANQFDKEKAYQVIDELTQEKYGGRKTGSEGGKKAGNWIADQFKSYGLHPYQDDSYFQSVSNALSLSNGDNIIGIIPSKYADNTQSIVIGAHYDHLGTNLNGQFYPGANDNASGTSVVMEIARVLSGSILLSRIDIIFIAFTGEEQGLYGSKYYVEHPLHPISDMMAMINLDMVGTGKGVWEIATNFPNHEPYRTNYQKAIREYKIKSKDPGWLTRPVTDHYPFYQKGVPILCLLKENPTNIGGYHTFQDTLETIDKKNLEECGKFSVYNLLSLVREFLVIPMINADSGTYSKKIWEERIFKEREINKLFFLVAV